MPTPDFDASQEVDSSAAATKAPSALPYVEMILANLEAPWRSKVDLRHLHMHFGYWGNGRTTGTDDDFVAAQDRLLEQLLNMAELADGMQILDVGSGFGGTTATIDSLFKAMRLVGLNIDPRQLDVSRRYLPQSQLNELLWVQADACTLPAKAASFDRILAVEDICHFSSRRAFLLEAARALRPAGRLVLSDMIMQPSVRQSLSDDEVWRTHRVIEAGYGPWPEFWVSPDYEELAGEAGLSIVQHHDVTTETLPSYTFIGVTAERKDNPETLTAIERAALVIQTLQEQALFTYELFTLEK